MTMRTAIFRCLLSAGVALAAGAASAKDAGKPPAQPMPGVDDGYSIVKPLPEPEEGAPATGGQFKIGDMDVRISGDIKVDIGFGNLRRPRR